MSEQTHAILYKGQPIEKGSEFNINRRWKMIKQQLTGYDRYYLLDYLSQKGIKETPTDEDLKGIQKVKFT